MTMTPQFTPVVPFAPKLTRLQQLKAVDDALADLENVYRQILMMAEAHTKLLRDPELIARAKRDTMRTGFEHYLETLRAASLFHKFTVICDDRNNMKDSGTCQVHVVIQASPSPFDLREQWYGNEE